MGKRWCKQSWKTSYYFRSAHLKNGCSGSSDVGWRFPTTSFLAPSFTEASPSGKPYIVPNAHFSPAEQSLRGGQVPLRVLEVLTDVYVGSLVKRSRQRPLLSERPSKIFVGKVMCGKLSCGKAGRRGRGEARWGAVEVWRERGWCDETT